MGGWAIPCLSFHACSRKGAASRNHKNFSRCWWMNFRDSEYLIPIFDFDILNMQLNTPLFIFALILLVMFFMNKLLFRPVLTTLESREGRLAGLSKGVAGQREEIGRLTADYEQKLEKVREEVAQVRQDARKETEEAVQVILSGARQDAQAELGQALSELGKEVEQAKSELRQAAQGLADKAANQILDA